ncbi:MFS transporter [Neoactinobaculum massilliense]|uniref:MFS transporter n=1 Tax=Neoactinobaculum massilliense TaxID=2364794 RepID=UPI000F5213BC|nr:MFS transporter [Neoactinobaculum massilliense]
MQAFSATALFQQNSNYRAWFAGDTSAEIGSQLTSLAFTLLAYGVTRDLVQAGLVGAVLAAARFLVILPGGHVIDRFEKTQLMRIYAASMMGIMALLAGFILFQALSFTWLLVFAVLIGLVNGTFGGLTNAMLPFLLQDEDLTDALALNETRDSVISVAASPLGGVLFGIHPVIPFVTDIAAYFGLFCASTRIHLRGQEDPRATLSSDASEDSTLGNQCGNGASESTGKPDNRVPRWRELFGGLTWLAHNHDVLAVLVMLTLSNFGNFLMISSTELKVQSDGNPGWVLGVIFSCFSAGMILGGLLTPTIQRVLSRRALTLLTFAWESLGMIAMSMASAWLGIAVCLLLLTIPVIAMNSVLGSYQMTRTPDSLQGRVGTAFMFVIGTDPILGGSLSGVLLASIGWGWTMLICCSFNVLAAGVAFLEFHPGDPAEGVSEV